MKNVGIFLVTFLAVYFGSFYILEKAKEEPLPSYGAVTDFELLDQRGMPVTFSETNGQPRVLSFFFTSCPHICPVLQGNMRKLHKKYGPRITLLSVSVDPKNDTEQVLNSYAEKLGADYNSWRFLQANDSQLGALLTSLKLGIGKDRASHTQRAVLIDEKGDIRGYYKALEPQEIERLKNDIERL